MTSQPYHIGFSKDWNDVPTSTTHVLLEIAKREPTLWVESIGTRTPKLTNARDLSRILTRIKRFFTKASEKENQLKVLSPLLLPNPRTRLQYGINRQLFSHYLRREGIDKKDQQLIFWSFLPNTLKLVEQYRHKSKIIYYCTDDWPLFGNLEEELTRKQENQLIAAADYLFVTAHYLQRKLIKLTDKPVHYISHGVPHAQFAQAVNKELPTPPFLCKLKKQGPIIGFYGNINEWIDFKLIEKLAAKQSHWQFIMIGPINIDIAPFSHLKNLHFPGRVEHSELPKWCAHFNAGFIPYNLKLERMKSVNPIKCREMLSAGLPVVAPMLEDLEALKPDVLRATTLTEWIESLESQCERKDRAAISERRIQDDWSNKVNDMMRIIK